MSHKKRKTGEKGATKALPSFANGDKVEEIVGARMIDGILHLFVMWYPLLPSLLFPFLHPLLSLLPSDIVFLSSSTFLRLLSPSSLFPRKGKKTCSFVKAEECNKIIPHKVISFYESRLKFETPLKVNDRTLTASISS